MEEERTTPVEKTNLGLLFFIYISITIAITVVMYLEYSKIYNILEEVSNSFATLLIVLISIVAMLAVTAFLIAKKLFRVLEVNSEYESEVTEKPSFYPPAVINFLYGGFTKNGADITATILDLIRKEYIIVEPGKTYMDILNPNVMVKLEKNTNAEELQLRDYEIDLLRLIFAEIGDGRNTSTTSIRRELLENPLYGPRITKWQNIVLLSIKEEKLIIDKKANAPKNTIRLMIAIFVSQVFIKMPLTLVVIVYAINQMLLAKAVFSDTSTRVFTSKGSEMYTKWMSYRKTLIENKPQNIEQAIDAIALCIDVKKESLFRVKDRYKK